ncbi:MAG: MFS transporter [Candidatus Omnitrophica bacterium]|nr:MFS transporter [Candidatus Omnitrophota bacterium]
MSLFHPISVRYKWWVVAMLWGVCFFNYADRLAIFSVFPVLQTEFGFSKAELGLIGSAFMWVYAGMAPAAGYIGDRLRRKTLILGGFFFWSIVTMSTGWASKFYQFFGIRALEGLGEAFYFPASMSVISDYHARSTRSRAMSLHQSSVYIGTIAGGALGGFFAEHFNWRTGFYVFGLAGMLLALFLSRFLREPFRGQTELESIPSMTPPEGPSVKMALREIFRTPTAVVLMLVFIGANFVAMTFLTWMPTFLGEKFGLKLTMAGLAGTLFIQLASAVGAPVGGLLADRLARWHPGGRMMVQAAGLIAGAAFVLSIGMTRAVPTLILAMTIFGFCKGLYDSNIFASLYDVVHPRARATAVGLMNAAGWLGGALAPATIGWVVTRGGTANEVDNLSRAIAIGSAIYLAGAFLLLPSILLFARRDVVRAWARPGKA